MRQVAILVLPLCLGSLCLAQPPDANWYQRAFYLLHEDHHTVGTAEVGRDADPAETARLINLSRPDAIQIHAKGNPGWTTYPSRIGHTPPELRRDVMAVWRGIADQYKYPFSAYFNLGRDGEIMKRHPEWNRSDANGQEIDRALCYHSGVCQSYLWPMIREVMTRYRPDGWWFDGSCFTVRLCYCEHCRARFKDSTGLEPPIRPADQGWNAYHEMQRQIYRECIRDTAKVVHDMNAQCLVAVNWANSLRMPEKPDDGLAYLTGDIGNRVEGLSAEGHWYDGIGLPFDLMTQLNTLSSQHLVDERQARLTMKPKPPVQIQQEMAIVVSNGGRFNVWDNPTPESGLVASRHEFLAEHVAPWLAARRPFCLGTVRLPDASLYHGAAAHYALNDGGGTVSFNRRNNRIEGAADWLPRLHLNYEMVGDWRLLAQNLNSRLLIVEHSKRLDAAEIKAIISFIHGGGTVLLTGMGINHGNKHPLHSVFGVTRVVGPKQAEKLEVAANDQRHSFDHYLFCCELATATAEITVKKPDGQTYPLLTCNQYGKGSACYFATPLLTRHGNNAVPPELMRLVFQTVLPAGQRWVTTDAGPQVELVLRKQAERFILHLVNMAEGDREVIESGRRTYTTIRKLPRVPASRISIRIPEQPARVTLQPQGSLVSDWEYLAGRVEVNVPAFEVHQMVMLEF